jgi:hypothetical protein
VSLFLLRRISQRVLCNLGTGSPRADVPKPRRREQQEHDGQKNGAQRKDANPRKMGTLDRVHELTSDSRLYPE